MDPEWLSLSFAPLCVLCVRSCGPPLPPHRKQAHAKDAKTAKKATIFLPKPTSSTCGVPRARLVWPMTRERFLLPLRPLRPLREILRSPLPPHRKQAHAKDAKAAKKATIFLPKPAASTCDVPRARLVWPRPGSGYLFPLRPLRPLREILRVTPASSRKGTQRRQLSFFQSRQRRPAMFLGQGLSGQEPG